MFRLLDSSAHNAPINAKPHYPPPGTWGGFEGAFLVKPSPGGGNFVKSYIIAVCLYTKVLQLLLCSTVMPRGFSRGLSNKIAPGESPLHLIIDKSPPVPGRG